MKNLFLFLAFVAACVSASAQQVTVLADATTGVLTRPTATLFKSANGIGAGGGGTWGSITGTLTDQTDLTTALGLKAPLADPTFSGTITGGTGTDLVMGGAWAGWSALTGRGLFAQRDGVSAVNLLSTGSTTGPNYTGSSTGGTLASLTATPIAHGMAFSSVGYDGTNWFVGSRIQFLTSEDQTAIARGNYIAYSTILTGATTLAERSRISGAGNLLVGATSDTGLTGSGGFKVGSTTASTSTTTGSGIFAGGIGVAGNSYFGGTLNVSGTLTTGAVTATTLTFTNMTGTVPIANGGTGATTVSAGYDALSGAETTVASATTTDLGAVTSNKVSITGTTTITGFGTATAGVERSGVFTGALTLTHNASSLILPGAANITTVAGDTFRAVSLGSGNWRVYSYNRADGKALASSSYVLSYGCQSGTNLAASTTLYCGWNVTGVNSTQGRYKIPIPVDGVLDGFIFTVIGNSSGGDSGHNLTIDAWINNTTSAGSTAVASNTMAGGGVVQVSGIGQAVSKWNGSTNYIELRVVAPAGMTTITGGGNYQITLIFK